MQRTENRGSKWIRSSAAALLLLTAAGCASAPAPKRAPAVFFPAAPELPRIQYLTSFSGRKDVEVQSRFNRFVVGEEQDVRLDKPYGVALRDGKIYVCDTNSTVIVFDLVHKSFGTLAGAVGPGKLVQPVNISIGEDGTKYVSDPVRGQVVAFGADDQYVRAYGVSEPWRPVDAVPFEGRLYVADFANSAVRVFDLASGSELSRIDGKDQQDGQIIRPTNLAIDPRGYLYVTDFARFQVLKFDRDGHFQEAIGKVGDGVGHFARPKGVAVDADGHLLVVDAAFNNVQIFNRNGRLLMFFGEAGEAPGNLLLPAKVTLDRTSLKYFSHYLDPGFQAESLIVVTSQFGPRLVNVFAYGKQKGARYPTDEELEKMIEQRRQQQGEKPQSQ